MVTGVYIARTYLQLHYGNKFFWQCLPFSWKTLRGKYCRHPIAVMGVVDAFRQDQGPKKGLTDARLAVGFGLGSGLFGSYNSD